MESPRPTVLSGFRQITTGARKNSVFSERHVATGWVGESSMSGLEYDREASINRSELGKVPSPDPQALYVADVAPFATAGAISLAHTPLTSCALR